MEQQAGYQYDSGIHDEIIEGWNYTGSGVAVVAVILAAFLGWNAVSLRDENIDLRESLAAVRHELDSKRAYDDSWTCTYDRKDRRSADGLVKHCIRTVEKF